MNARVARIAHAAADARPGRSCPVSYRYSPRVFDRAPEFEAEVLYVVGGLYGNVEALQAIRGMAAREARPVTLVFNGDFHWFDVGADAFSLVSEEVLRHRVLRGNVETEIAHDDGAAGCGCAYPMDVSDADVQRSNEILERLRATARAFSALRSKLAALPMHFTAQVGAARIGIVHGDAASLAGWGFAHDRLDEPSHGRWLESVFRDARVDIFASTHTCLPAFRAYQWGSHRGVVANNGAAGMPNVAGTRFGLVTRIAATPCESGMSMAGAAVAGVHVDALRVDYDHGQWLDRFLASWPPGSAAHASYFRRIVDGPAFVLPSLAAARTAV